ncbi:MAG: ornithine cyclodeaminase [Rhodothermaceae bacterium]|nr:ornithine cyclodeaminase [Rhodothermaceae bacterium]MYF64047.1 ornithine cyclodeaminase [Rhodothermaceae bacterium]MYI83961.1 ornithine cyclodeaminase [Rhodothermaceae bacterium]
MPSIRVLSRKNITSAITMRQAIDLMRDGFVALSSGRASVPVRMNMPLEEHGGRSLFMPVYSPDHGQVGLKVVNLSPDNPDRGLPFIHAIVMVSDAQTGTPLALMDGEYITALRTGAGAGLATEVLSRPSSSVLAMFGTGVQANTQLEAICTVRPIKKVIVFGRSHENTEAFVKRAARRYDIKATYAKAPEELTEADVVCTATTSLTPVFSAEHIAPGTHINGIGSYRPDMTEIPAQTVADAKVVVDQCEACLKEAGDLMVPICRGEFDESHIYAELGEVLMGNVEGRTNDSEITFFKSVGNAIQDLVVASFLEERARQEDLGVEIAL